MIRSIELKFTDSDNIIIPTDGVTIFVGPNNSGKSLLLREIEQIFNVMNLPDDFHIIKDFEIEWPSKEEISKTIEKSQIFRRKGLPIGNIILGRINPGGGHEVNEINEDQLYGMASSRDNKGWMTSKYLKWGVIRLDGRSRFNLTNEQGGGDLLSPPQNVLAHLFQDDVSRYKVRSLVHDAFGLYFVVDPTNLGNLRIRLSESPPLTDEQSLNTEARNFHKNAIYIKDASDGVQAFTGIVTAVCSGEFHTILVDEPEAFLHPPLARKLGKHLSSLAEERGGVLLASTHSADFLMGCVQSSKSVRVVRLEYSRGKSRGRMIDPQSLETFFKRPLMRSANVISGLFHDGVVILESDNDRAFYSEIYHRLADGKADYPSILFINAQNKQTIKDMMGPLRQFGVPAAAIPDIDVVKDGGKTWTDWLKAAQVPETLHLGYGQQRSSIDAALRATGKDMKADGGIEILSLQDRVAADQFFKNLEEFGIFPVRRGELEKWLLELKIPGKKTDWTVAMLERLGSDPADPNYVKPTSGDVWEFLEVIVAWIRNSARRGTA